MRFKPSFLPAVFAIIIALSSCSKKEELNPPPLSDYMPLQTGKYITYRIDSLVFANFGRNEEVHRYQVRHVIDAKITDNLGRPAYRVFTYINDSTASGSWVPNGTYYIAPLDNRIEIIDEYNLRFVKMCSPLREGFSWDGNNYLNIEPYSFAGYNFGTYAYMKDWDYYYAPFEPDFSYNGKNYTDVYTVEEQDIEENYPVTNTLGSGAKFRAYEKYSKGIGLVFREFSLIEYEPNPSGSSPFYTGFGTTMWMIDHN